MSITGKYKLVRNENFIAHLKAFGVSEDFAGKIDQLRPVLEIIVNGDEVCLKSDSGVDNASSTLILDKEVDEPMPMNINLKSVAKLDGNILSITSKAESGIVGRRVYKLIEENLILTISTDDEKIPPANRIYEKIDFQII